MENKFNDFEVVCLYLSRYFQDKDLFDHAKRAGWVNWDEVDAYHKHGIEDFMRDNEIIYTLANNQACVKPIDNKITKAADEFAEAAIKFYKALLEN